MSIEFLQKVSLFQSLSPDELKQLSEKCESLQLRKDTVICKEGDLADALYIIKSGIVQVYCTDYKGNKKIISHLMQGDYFGEMALLTDEIRKASASAFSDVELIKIKKEDFTNLIKSNSNVSLAVIKTLCERLNRSNISYAKTKNSYIYTILGPDLYSGKSFLSRNLAYAIMKITNQDVLLFDPNLRNDSVARNLGIDNHSNIIDDLVENEKITNINQYIIRSPSGVLTIIPQHNGATDLRFKEFHTFILLDQIFNSYKLVVIDSSSLYTKVTKELIQISDRIIYLLSSKNISVGGLIKHFEDIRRGWNIDSSKVIYVLNHNTNNPELEGHINLEDRRYIKYELPYDDYLGSLRTPEKTLFIQLYPNHKISKSIFELAEEIIYDQHLYIYFPNFNNDENKKLKCVNFMDNCKSKLATFMHHVTLTTPVKLYDNTSQEFHQIYGRTTKWNVDNHMLQIVEIIQNFKIEFNIPTIKLVLNNQENVI